MGCSTPTSQVWVPNLKVKTQIWGFQHQTSQAWVNQNLKTNSHFGFFQRQTSQVWVPTPKIICNLGVCKTKLRIFAGTTQKTRCLPRGSVWSFEGGVLLSASLGLAVRTFWSDLEKFPKSASGEILEGSGQHSGLWTCLCQKMVRKKMVLWRNYFVVGF